MPLPDLVRFEDYGGCWETYRDALFEIYQEQLSQADLRFRGLRVSCERNPETDGKDFRFWHLVADGEVEEDRIPNMRRCERLQWIAWVIQNADTCDEIDVWENKRKGQRSVLLWYQEDFLVVLRVRNGYYLLKSGYCIEYESARRKKRKERDAYYRNAT